MSKYVITAEPLQFLLVSLGYHEAHARIGELADKAMEAGKPVVELALEDSELRPFMERLTQDQLYILSHPEAYTGLALKKAEEVASVLEEMLKEEKLW